jgi:hypothetical protein
MHRAIDKLLCIPQYLIIDGNRFNKYGDTPHACIVKGDSKYFSIAAASILAKTYRDDYMKQIALEHPEYEWHSNKGYPTISHRKMVLELGHTPYHRKTFRVTDPASCCFIKVNCQTLQGLIPLKQPILPALRILILTHRAPFPQNGGYPIVVGNTIKGLVALGHDVSLISLNVKKNSTYRKGRPA